MKIQKMCYFIILNILFYANLHVEASTNVVTLLEACMHEYKLLLFKYLWPVGG